MSSIPNRWLAKMPAKTIKGNGSDSEAHPADITIPELLQMLNLSMTAVAGSYPKYRISPGLGIAVGDYEQYVIHDRKELVIDLTGSISVSTGGEIIIK